MTARWPALLAALATPFFLVNCAGGGGGTTGSGSPYEIVRSSAPKEQLLTYQTYAWTSERTVNLGDAGGDARAVNNRIVSIVNQELDARGLTRTSLGQADLLVSCEAVAVPTEDTPVVDGEAGKAEAADQDAAGEDGNSEESPEAAPSIMGSLSVKLRERRSGRDVYRGFAESTVLDDPSVWKAETELQSSVSRMLADFPRQP